MRSLNFVAYDIAILAVIFTHNMIIPVKCQCTVKGCESGDSSISIAAEIPKLLMEFHERLQAIDRHSQSAHERLNASFQQMQNQQNMVMTSLQAIDRRLQEQDIYINQVQSIRELLNTSLQESEAQHDNVFKRFEAIDRRLIELDITIKNETQNSWKLAIAVGLDLTRSPVPPIIDNWIVIMHRSNGSLNFNRNWIEYRDGFGDIGRGEFWLGNEKIHRLTNRFFYTLRIEVQLKANGLWYHADYSAFSIDSENNKYTLRLSGFSGGNAGDSLTNSSARTTAYLGGMNFTTWDADNDRQSGGNCASTYGGGWWFNACHDACLTCQYNHYSLKWFSLNHLSSDEGRLRASRMMIKSR